MNGRVKSLNAKAGSFVMIDEKGDDQTYTLNENSVVRVDKIVVPATEKNRFGTAKVDDLVVVSPNDGTPHVDIR